MLTFPLVLQFKIPAHQLLPFKDSIDGGWECVFIANISGFEYYLSIFPNGYDEESRGKTWIGLGLELGDVEKVEANNTIRVESADYSSSTLDIYEESFCSGDVFCTTEEFFNPEKKFIVDGKFTIQIYGTFKFEPKNDETFEQQKWDGRELGNELWQENDDKDFTIVVEGKDIKVHKLLLRIQSDVFKAMLNPKTKESVEKKVEIPDFSFVVVETAVKMIYNCNFTSSLSLDETMFLLQFFDKYNIPPLKEKVELLLTNQISAATVCRITNCSALTNSINLESKCMEFLEKSFASKTPVSNIEILDKDIVVKIHQNLVYYNVKTE